MSNQLRPYQEQGFHEIIESWRSGNINILYQLVTGGGKTVLFVHLIKMMVKAGKRVMLIAHREELINQAWQKLYDNEIYAGIIKADVKPNYALPCQVASIQTICRRKELPDCHFIIIDECHHAMDDNTYGRVLIDSFPRARVLGVTATPYRLSGKGFTKLFERMIQGPSFRDLVSSGYLAPVRYFVSSMPNLDDIKIDKGEYNADQAEEAMKMAPLVESYREHCEGMSGVVFAVNVGHSNRIVDQYMTAGIPAAHIDANTHPDKRKFILSEFRAGRIKVISNVGIITEGFDFPDMQFVQLARPTKSLSLYLQMVGRVTRTNHEDTKHAATDEARVIAVARSRKPFGIVLDNAGAWKEHGLPDQDIDWNVHFEGYERRKKKKGQVIEIVESYIAEDEDGRRVMTDDPEELEGLKLIEVTRTVREKIVNIVSIKELDAQLIKLARIPHIKKVGFAAYAAYKTHCRKNHILMSVEVWDYIKLKLVDDPGKTIKQQAEILEKDFDTINAQDIPEDEKEFLRGIRQKKHDKVVEQPKRIKIPTAFWQKEMQAYFEAEKASQKQIAA